MVNVRGLVSRLFGGEAKALDEQQTGDARVAQLHREFAEHPSRGITPERLHQIMELAEQGDLKAQSELFEDMEERDAQIGADLAKRRQLAAELEWQIVPPDGANRQEKKAAAQAAEVFAGLEVEDLIIELGAGIGHGWVNLELPWARDGDIRFIEQPLFRPHSWFRLHPDDQNRITLRDNSANGADLWPLGWVQHRHRAKSGYLARSGLHRQLAWPYLFKHYSVSDLAELLEIYGLPARIGKYPSKADPAEKSTLLRAVTSLGHNAAGIIPEGMSIEFMTAAGAAGGAEMFQVMIHWCERSIAKSILGGTLTSGTGEGTNTNALGNVHERGQQSLINSDIRQYAGTINRDILWPMAALNYGIDQRRRAPRFYLDAGQGEDLQRLADTLPVFISMMDAKIPTWWFHEKSRIPRATEEEIARGEILQLQPSVSPAQAATRFKTGVAALKAKEEEEDGLDNVVSELHRQAGDATDQTIKQIRHLVDSADSFEQLREQLMALQLDSDQLTDALTQALTIANLAGRYDLIEEAL